MKTLLRASLLILASSCAASAGVGEAGQGIAEAGRGVAEAARQVGSGGYELLIALAWAVRELTGAVIQYVLKRRNNKAEE